MTHYELLQVSPEASTEVIEASWKTLMKKYHPDKKTGNAQLAEKLNQAHDILSDPEKRKVYDLSLNGSIRMPGETRGEYQYRQAQSGFGNGTGAGRRRASRAYPDAYPRRSFSQDQVTPEEAITEQRTESLIEQVLEHFAESLGEAGRVSLEQTLIRLNEETIRTIDKNPFLRAFFGRNR